MTEDEIALKFLKKTNPSQMTPEQKLQVCLKALREISHLDLIVQDPVKIRDLATQALAEVEECDHQRWVNEPNKGKCVKCGDKPESQPQEKEEEKKIGHFCPYYNDDCPKCQPQAKDTKTKDSDFSSPECKLKCWRIDKERLEVIANSPSLSQENQMMAQVILLCLKPCEHDV